MELTKENLKKAIRLITDQGAALLTELAGQAFPETANSPELKENIRSLIDISGEQQRIESAFDSIDEYLQRSSFPAEIEEIKENWVQAFAQFTDLLQGKKEGIKENSTEPIQNLIGLSPKTYEIFYAAGKDLYNQKEFEKAGNIFLALTLFNHCYPSVWLSFGLSEQKCGRLDVALRSFAMAAITDIDSPEPLLCAADCCIEMNDREEAKIYLEEAQERIEKNPQFESFRSIADVIGMRLNKA